MAKSKEVKNLGGRPTKYKEEYDTQVYKLCLVGMIDTQIADFFEVDVSTINNWKKDHPSFFESIKKGKDLADAEVANALYHRAKGYSHEDVDIRSHNGQIVQTSIIKHYPPDATSAIFWLKNRQSAQWRDKQEIKMDVNPVSQLMDEILSDESE